MDIGWCQSCRDIIEVFHECLHSLREPRIHIHSISFLTHSSHPSIHQLFVFALQFPRLLFGHVELQRQRHCLIMHVLKTYQPSRFLVQAVDTHFEQFRLPLELLVPITHLHREDCLLLCELTNMFAVQRSLYLELIQLLCDSP